MKENKIKEGIEELYENWLLEEHLDEIKNKDDLIDKTCDGYRYDEFIKLVKENL